MKFPGMRRAAMAATIALTVAGVAAAGLPAAQAAPARSRNVVVSCTGRALVRPVIYNIACASGNEHMAGMSWTSWGPKAHGVGRDEIRLSGKFHGARLLDVGCGWGAMAIHAAREYGATVVGITLSEQQRRYAVAQAEREGVSDLVEFRLQDFRDVRDGHYLHIWIT